MKRIMLVRHGESEWNSVRRLQGQADIGLSRLGVFATGSAPIPPVLVEEAGAVLGCRVYALWGMTENGCVTITRPEDPPMRAAESDGTPVPGMQVRVSGRDTADQLRAPVPEMRQSVADPPGRLRHLHELRLQQVRVRR